MTGPNTTPGADRGRELAEISYSVLGEYLCEHDPDHCTCAPFEGQHEPHCGWTPIAYAENVRRALAAPAETEAGAQPEGMCQECRGWVPLVLDLHRSDVEDPCGGSEGVPACGARTDPGQVLCTKPVGHDNGAHAPASPPAQGPGETEAGDLDRWLGEQIEHARRDAASAEVRGWINTADTQEARRDAFREVRARLVPTPPAPGEGQGATKGGGVTTAEVIAWHRARFGGDPADVLVMGKLAEETGEVCGAITKRAEGAVRPAKGLVTREDWSAHLLDEVGDVGIVLHTLCAREGTTLDEVVTRRFRDDVSLRTGQEAQPAPAEGHQ